MSKSGLFAHFGSKEELQLATVERAGEIFDELVYAPAEAGATGLERLRLLAESFLKYVQDGTYPGGCFYASVAVELATRPGPVHDSAMNAVNRYFSSLVEALRTAQAEGDIDQAEDAEQLAFEIDSFLLLANLRFVLSSEAGPIDQAREAIGRRLAEAGAPA